MTECFNEGEVIFSNSSVNEYEGTFEICFGGLYGHVCDIGWRQSAAEFVCRSQFGEGIGNNR